MPTHLRVREVTVSVDTATLLYSAPPEGEGLHTGPVVSVARRPPAPLTHTDGRSVSTPAPLHQPHDPHRPQSLRSRSLCLVAGLASIQVAMHRVMVDPAQAVEPFGAQKIDRTASDRRANDVDPERRALDFRDRALL